MQAAHAPGPTRTRISHLDMRKDVQATANDQPHLMLVKLTLAGGMTFVCVAGAQRNCRSQCAAQLGIAHTDRLVGPPSHGSAC